jgi:nitroreductase
MSTINRNQLIDQLQWRYATKQFDPARKINTEDWAALEQSLLLTPSSFGLQPWRIINVTTPAIREQLVPFSWGQRQIADASHLLVLAVKKEITEADIDGYLSLIAQVRGIPRESLESLRGMMVGNIIKGMDSAARRTWATKQAYIALGNFLTSAALLGIDTCPIEGFEPPKYDEILGLDKEGLTAVVVAVAGYRAAGDKYAGLKKVRLPKEKAFVTR